MEPGFYRGDILFLYQPKQPAQTGDISESSWQRPPLSSWWGALSPPDAKRAGQTGLCCCCRRQCPVGRRGCSGSAQPLPAAHGTLQLCSTPTGGKSPSCTASSRSTSAPPTPRSSTSSQRCCARPGAAALQAPAPAPAAMLSRLPAPRPHLAGPGCRAPHKPRPARAATLQGDNNWGDDRSLYPKGQLWLNTGHIMGKVVGCASGLGGWVLCCAAPRLAVLQAPEARWRLCCNGTRLEEQDHTNRSNGPAPARIAPAAAATFPSPVLPVHLAFCLAGCEELAVHS